MIKWTEIETECGDYRQGFVAIFRKYEGQPTDEKDAQGRTVKVTQSSFARHMGIAVSTFKDWVRDNQAAGRRPVERDRQAEIVRSTARKNPEAIVKAVAELPEERQREIVHEIMQKKFERQGADFSEPSKKAARAHREEAWGPIKQALNTIRIVPMIEAVTDALRCMPRDLDPDDRAQIEAAFDELVLAHMEFNMKYESQA